MHLFEGHTMTPSPRSIDAMVDRHIFGRGEEYHVMKLGLYYRPPANGYTSNTREAARYSKEEAEKLVSGCSGEVTMVLCEPEPRSTDIAAAMDVADALNAMEIHLVQKIRSKLWYCRLITRDRLVGIRSTPIVSEAEAPTRPLAISLAALKVKGITI